MIFCQHGYGSYCAMLVPQSVVKVPPDVKSADQMVGGSKVTMDVESWECTVLVLGTY